MFRIILVLIAIIAGMSFLGASKAGFFSDVKDAVVGHVEDVKERIGHEDSFIDGYVVSRGEFRRDDPGRDGAHWADGTVSLVERDGRRYIQLGPDFNSGPAPDLYIYVADSKVVDEKSFFAASPTSLGPLQSGSGAQFYELSEFIHVPEDLEVIIWCRRFSQFIGAVTL